MAQDRVPPPPPPPPRRTPSPPPKPVAPPPAPTTPFPPAPLDEPAAQPPPQSRVGSSSDEAATITTAPKMAPQLDSSANTGMPVRLIVTVVVAVLLVALGGYSYFSSQHEREQAAVLDRQQAEERMRREAEADAAKAAEQARLAEERAKDAEERATSAQLALETEKKQTEQRSDPSMGEPPTPATAPIANDAESLVRQMLIASQGNSDLELKTLISQISALPKPENGSRKTARALNTKGLAQLRAGAIDQAISTFQQAFAADPADVEIIDNLGFASIKAGDYRRARTASFAALALAPSRSSAWANLGISLAETEDEKQAVAAFGNAYRFSGDVAKTITYLESLLQNDPSLKVRAAAKQALSIVAPN